MIETWDELQIATDFRDIVQLHPKAWEPFVNFDALDKYIESKWEAVGEDR